MRLIYFKFSRDPEALSWHAHTQCHTVDTARDSVSKCEKVQFWFGLLLIEWNSIRLGSHAHGIVNKTTLGLGVMGSQGYRKWWSRVLGVCEV